jgi:protein-tyrosine phosphatase
MREVVPKLLWLGTALDARDLRRLYENQIAAVVDLAIEEPPAVLGREIIYCRFPLIDGAGNPGSLLHLAIQTTAALLQDSVSTLVACSGGMSRSPAIVAAALSSIRGIPADDCLLQVVAGQPHDVSPLLWRDAKQKLARGT